MFGNIYETTDSSFVIRDVLPFKRGILATMETGMLVTMLTGEHLRALFTILVAMVTETTR